MLKGIWSDLILAVRALAKARAFSFVCVISLGIGMAPVIAVPYLAQIIDTPPAGLNTDTLVEILTTQSGPRQAADRWSYPDFVDLRAADTGIAIVGWIARLNEITLPGGGTIRSSTLYVSEGYFKTMGVTPAQGPGFTEAMHDPLNAGPAVILGHDFWQNRLDADPDIIGKTLIVNEIPHLVVGIAPESFRGHQFEGRELFVPLESRPLFMTDDSVRFDRGNEWIQLHGRLSPGVGIARASAAVSAVTSRLAEQYPSTNEFKAGAVEPYHPVGALARSDLAGLQAVALTLTGTVLLVVCLNISGMMQVRSAMRERELSIRQAIGATRGQLVRYLLSEALLLAVVGGALASLVLFNMPPVLAWMSGQSLPRQFQEALSVDLYMIAICIGLCLVTSLLFGLLPARRFSRPVVITALKDDAGGGGLRVGRVHRATAALQVAIAVPLIVIGGISLDRVRSTAMADLGYHSDLLYAAPLDLSGLPAEGADFRIRSARGDLATAAGVASVTVADGLPLDFQYRLTRVSLPEEGRLISAHVTRVGDRYLETMGIPLLLGRGFGADDGAGAEMVTIVSKTLVDRLFPDTDAAEVIGRRLLFGSPGDEDRPQQTLTVVGVTADFPTSQMSNPREQLLLPLAQHAVGRRSPAAISDDFDYGARLMLIARSNPGEQPARMTAALENVVREFDPEFLPSTIVTGVGLRQYSIDDFLTQSAVAGVTSGVILTLAALGIYGVVGLMVSTRTREIAVRVALGATRRRVLGLILFDVVKLVTPGVGVGLFLTAALNRLNAENMGISLSNVEYMAYVLGALTAILVAVIAGLAPARRAATVQPMVAMRSG